MSRTAGRAEPDPQPRACAGGRSPGFLRGRGQGGDPGRGPGVSCAQPTRRRLPAGRVLLREAFALSSRRSAPQPAVPRGDAGALGAAPGPTWERGGRASSAQARGGRGITAQNRRASVPRAPERRPVVRARNGRSGRRRGWGRLAGAPVNQLRHSQTPERTSLDRTGRAPRSETALLPCARRAASNLPPAEPRPPRAGRRRSPFPRGFAQAQSRHPKLRAGAVPPRGSAQAQSRHRYSAQASSRSRCRTRAPGRVPGGGSGGGGAGKVLLSACPSFYLLSLRPGTSYGSACRNG